MKIKNLVIKCKAFTYPLMWMNRSTHLIRTALATRNEITSRGFVKELKSLSPTVKELNLHIEDKSLLFKPGQWVDFLIPGVSTVGGFSIVSPPHELATKQRLRLAVKFSKHPPAFWVHNKCQVGDCVHVRVGGDCFYSPAREDLRKNILLVSGGVGINPLLSILLHVNHLQSSFGENEGSLGKVVLLYSVKSHDELIFEDEILEIAGANANISCSFFVTGESDEDGDRYTYDIVTAGKRIDEHVIKEAVQAMSRNDYETLSFLCGPKAMMIDMNTYLLNSGLSQDNIRYECWW